MFDKIYKKNEFIVFPIKKGFVACNLNKKFHEGHTHLKNFEAAKTAVDLVINKKIPKSTNNYYLESLIRLSNDISYIDTIKELILTRRKRGIKSKYNNNSFEYR